MPIDEKLFEDLLLSFEELEKSGLHTPADRTELFRSRRSTLTSLRFPGMMPIRDDEKKTDGLSVDRMRQLTPNP